MKNEIKKTLAEKLNRFHSKWDYLRSRKERCHKKYSTVKSSPIEFPPDGTLKTGLKDIEVPEWLRFPLMTVGYRMGGNYKSCLRSAFMWHNETLNAWTMIGISAFSLAFMIYCLVVLSPKGCDITPFVAMFLSVFIHMPFSVGYHLFLPISPIVYNQWRKLDIMFIFVASCFLTYSLCYFIMPVFATWLITGIAILTSTVAIWKTARLATGEPMNRNIHTMFIATIVLVYYFPILYQGVRDLIDHTFTFAVATMIVVPLTLAFGGCVYANHWPECKYPKKFDLFGRSHQILHILAGVAHAMECFFIYSVYLRFGA
jgi:adiponectin receptor